MKKLMSLIIIAMFALSMSLGTFAATQDKPASSTTEQKPKSTKSTKKSKTKKTKDTSATSSDKSKKTTAPAAAPAK